MCGKPLAVDRDVVPECGPSDEVKMWCGELGVYALFGQERSLGRAMGAVFGALT